MKHAAQSAFRHKHTHTLLLLVVLLCAIRGSAFLPSQCLRTTSSYATRNKSSSSSSSSSSLLNAEKKEVTLKELMKELERNPEKYLANKNVAKKSKRTRKKVAVPKQEYVYAAQRRAQTNAATAKTPSTTTAARDVGKSEPSIRTPAENTLSSTINPDHNPIHQARLLGLMNAANQHCDAPIAAVEPQIVGRVQVSPDETKTSSYAYIIEKPAGWSILGGDKKKRTVDGNNDDDDDDDDDDGSFMDKKQMMEEEKEAAPKLSMAVLEDNDSGADVEIIEWDAADMLAAMTPEEIAEFEAEGGFEGLMGSSSTGTTTRTTRSASSTTTINEKQKPALTRASFELYVRPSVVNWLKETKASEGTPIRGGKFWTAVAGATNVDDSGLVVMCPKDKVDNIFVDFAKYVAVVGTGKFLAAKPKGLVDEIKKESTELEVIAKLRKGRGDDTVLTVGMSIAEHFSTCNHAVQVIQDSLQDGVRGDPAANPFDRRATRRLLHCDAISLSSLAFDDAAEVQSAFFPDDIAVLAERRNNHEFVDGSFLGRTDLLDNPYTNAYREINGAADGFPGWNVDRYDKWLLVQHDDEYPRGPLPSIHDGNTAGVYYLPADPNRSSMGRAEIRPVLLEGKPAPNVVPIQENGVTYLATLDKDLSTGLFLDQRPQRAWLKRNCNSKTRVLNCFAHCGAFTVAAASAGASTVSLDLNKKFLDRIPPQLELNGIDFLETDGDNGRRRHDAIFGDCFDWLARFAKRGEEFDLIILDPPSTSIGIKKRRWSVKNDMAELVALAAPMVKRGGLLWTTTNSATIHPMKFAKMCKKGLDDVGMSGAKLERVVPMPSDFQCVGSQPVKNLVWRIP